MNTAPVPGPPDRLDPAAIWAEVDAVLSTAVPRCGAPGTVEAAGTELAAHADTLDQLHQRLAAVLATVDRI